MRAGRKAIVVAVLLISAMVLGACSKEEFSTERAYRDASELDYDTAPDIPLTVDGRMLTEDDQKRIFEAYEILNTVRKDEGLKELKWDQDLSECALIRAEEIAVSFDHTRPSGAQWYTLYPGMLLGENIGKGSEHADMVMEDWLKNQPDRENFLCDGFTRTALGLFRDDKGQCYWVFEFGNEQSKRFE